MGVKSWLLNVALKKWVKRAIVAGVGWIGGHRLAEYGVTVDPEILSVAVWGVLDVLRNRIKFNTGWNWL